MHRIILASLPAAFAIAAAMTQLASADDGLSLFQDNCSACHMGEERGPDRIAPPVFAVKNHYIQVHPAREAFVKALAEWIRAPAADRVLMPGAVRRFGLMEPVDIDAQSATKIAEFIFSARFDRPGWYAKHYREEHGKDPE